MPAIVNVAINALWGAAVAWFMQHSPALRRTIFSWPLLFALAFESVVFTPVATYLFRFYPQWSLLYLFDPQIHPQIHNWVGWLSAAAILGNYAALLGAYAAMRHGVLNQRKWLQGAPVVVAVAVLLYVLLIFGKRLVFISDYDGFWSGQAQLVVTRMAGWLTLLTYGAAAGFLVWMRRHFRDHDPSWL